MPHPLRQIVCALADLPDPGAHGFSPPGARFPDEYFVVRCGRTIRAYQNVCPHAGNSLNWKEHAFLTRDKRLIMCAAHGALFDPLTGVCVAGPCVGRALQTVHAQIEGQEVVAYFSGLPPSVAA